MWGGLLWAGPLDIRVCMYIAISCSSKKNSGFIFGEMSVAEELCGRCERPLRAERLRTCLPKSLGRGNSGTECQEVCGRCYFACEIRRLSAQPFELAESEQLAENALRNCWLLLTQLRNDEKEKYEEGSGSATEEPKQKRARTQASSSR